jgi:hypothetical protein
MCEFDRISVDNIFFTFKVYFLSTGAFAHTGSCTSHSLHSMCVNYQLVHNRVSDSSCVNPIGFPWIIFFLRSKCIFLSTGAEAHRKAKALHGYVLCEKISFAKNILKISIYYKTTLFISSFLLPKLINKPVLSLVAFK